MKFESFTVGPEGVTQLSGDEARAEFFKAFRKHSRPMTLKQRYEGLLEMWDASARHRMMAAEHLKAALEADDIARIKEIARIWCVAELNMPGAEEVRFEANGRDPKKR